MTFNFDKVVSRFGTNCAKWDGMAQSMGDDMISLRGRYGPASTVLGGG